MEVWAVLDEKCPFSELLNFELFQGTGRVFIRTMSFLLITPDGTVG